METKKPQKKTAANLPARRTQAGPVANLPAGASAKAGKAPAKEAAPKKVAAKGLSAPVYNVLGKEVSTVTLPENVFAAKWNADLVHQVVTAMQSNARAGLGRAHTKDRSEVRGGGKKPWRQKGTGRARHGSSRSPIWVGGGVTHGPRTDKDYTRTVPKKMRRAALFAALSEKFKRGQILFVDTIAFANPSAKEAKNVLTKLAAIDSFEKTLGKKQNAALVALASNDANVKKSFGNFGNIAVEESRNLNPVDLLSATVVIIESPDESLKQIAKN